MILKNWTTHAKRKRVEKSRILLVRLKVKNSLSRYAGSTRIMSFATLMFMALLTLSSAHAEVYAPRDSGPRWLILRPGVAAMVDVAPWDDDKHAALAAQSRDYKPYADGYGPPERPRSAMLYPIGTRVTVVAVYGKIVKVRTMRGRIAFTASGRLVPIVPPNTELRAAGGYDDYAHFYPTLSTTEERADHLPSGSHLVSLGMAVGKPEPYHKDIVRVRVRVTSGTFAGRIGWILPGGTGIPTAPVNGIEVNGACGCYPVLF